MLSMLSGCWSGSDLNDILQSQNLILKSGAFRVEKWLDFGGNVTNINWRAEVLSRKPIPRKHQKYPHLLWCPFNGKLVSSSSLALMSSKSIVINTHNCGPSTISVDSSKWREKHSHAFITFLSCSSTSTAVPSQCFVEVLWERCTSFKGLHDLFVYCWSLQKGYLLPRESFLHNIAMFEWLLVFSNEVTRSVTRLDSTRRKKQVWRPHVRTWGLSEANVLYWKSTCDIVGTFRRPRQSFSASIVIRCRGNSAPLPPRYTHGRDCGDRKQ